MISAVPIYNSALDISSPYKTILVDAWGVFYQGDALGPFENAKETLSKLVSNGKIVCLLSNSTNIPIDELINFRRWGICENEHFHHLITSGGILRDLCNHDKLPFPTKRKAYMVICNDDPNQQHLCERIFSTSGYKRVVHTRDADFLYIASPSIHGVDQLDPLRFKPYVDSLPLHLPMLCANPDLIAHEGNPSRAVVRQGAIARMFENRGGKVFYVGKPGKAIFQAALYKSECKPSEALMIGDSLSTDIHGANHCGIHSALVTQTGIAGDYVQKFGLEDLWRKCPPNYSPNFWIKRFAPV